MTANDKYIMVGCIATGIVVFTAIFYVGIEQTRLNMESLKTITELQIQYAKELDAKGLKTVCEKTGEHYETRYRSLGKFGQQEYRVTVPDYSCKVVTK